MDGPSPNGRPTLRLTLLLALAMTLALLATGCEPTARDPAAPIPTQADAKAFTASPAAGGEPRAAATARGPEAFEGPPADDLGGGKLVEETWDAYSMQGTRVGYARTTIAEVTEEGRTLLRTSTFTRTVMQRAGQTLAQDLTLTSWDTPDGRLVRFESRMATGGTEPGGQPAAGPPPSDLIAVGAVRDGQLGIDVTTLGRTQSQKIPWQDDWGGVFAVDQSLRRKPLQPAETRTIRCLLPVFNLPGEVRLSALTEETVVLPAGPKRLLKVRSVTDVAGQPIESLQWVDGEGRTWRTLVPSIGQEAVRTTKEDALRRGSGPTYDLLAASTVPLASPLPQPQRTRRVVYRARVNQGTIAGLFVTSAAQQVTPIDDRTAEVTVVAIRPDRPGFLENLPAPPDEADLAANNFIQSDDRDIRALAAAVAPDEQDPWKLACALEAFVDQAIREKSFSQAFATAAEVARSREGDCTEHAVLMAALCRARKLPARVAFGLVYYPPERGFAYHMWNEVWIDDRWIALDPTLGQGGVAAERLQLGRSNLAGGSPLADLLTVIQAFGRLKLEVLSVEHEPP